MEAGLARELGIAAGSGGKARVAALSSARGQSI